jgi:predicted esterase
MLIGLHENASMASNSMPFWQPAAKTGWLVAVVQSSQALWKGAYVWDDRRQAERRIIDQYNALKNRYAIDPDRVILGGLSLGGDIAIWLTLERKIPACGFIAIAPDGPCIDFELECSSLVEKNEENPARGYIIVGAEDNTIHLERIQLFASYLNRSGIECKLHIVPNASHDFNLTYEYSLLEGLAYLLE